MGTQNQTDRELLRQLFEHFVDAGLHGRAAEALSLIDEPYTGVGMGEQGIVHSIAEAELVLEGGYRSTDESVVECEIEDLTINLLSDDVATLLGQVKVTNTPKNGQPMHSGLMQTIIARRNKGRWAIAFTHASPTILTVESVEAYPIRFMDHTISLLKAGLQAETMLYAEVNLTQNKIVRLECKAHNWSVHSDVHTFEDVIRCGLNGLSEQATEQEYYAFFNRLRLLGLFAEGVTQDQFNYDTHIETGILRLRASVDMVKQAYTGDIVAVISYASLDSQKLELEQATHRAFHDSLTGILNRNGFENQVAELLHSYDPLKSTALFMIDLDDFKQINDRLGHQTGDTVLHQVADVLQNTFQEYGIVGRVGGDEFMVMVVDNFSADFLENLAQALLKSATLHIGGSKQIPVSISIGIAYGRGRISFDQLYRLADIALYSAKKAGKCRYHMVNADLGTETGMSGSGVNLLSLQSLLDYTQGKELTSAKTPYEALLESIPGGVVVLELSGPSVKITYCNDWVSRFIGYTQEEIAAQQSQNAFAFVHPDDIPAIIATLDTIQKGVDSFNITYRVLHKNGYYRHIAMAATTTARQPDSVILYGINTDVDEVFHLQREIETANNSLQSLLNTIPGGVLILSLGETLKLTHCNDYMARMLGYPPGKLAALEAKNPLFLVHPDDLPRLHEALARMRAGEETVNIIYRLLDAKGQYHYVRIVATLTECRQEECLYYGVITNVDEMIAAQHKLESSHKKLDALVAAIPGGIAMIELSDKAVVTHYGISGHDVLGYHPKDGTIYADQLEQLGTLWPEDIPKVLQAMAYVRDHDENQFDLSVRIKCKDGTPKPIHVRGAVVDRTAEATTLYLIYSEIPS